MKIVYIAHPVSGDVPGNIRKIIEIVRFINLTEPDVVPFVPYLPDLYALDDNNPEERKRGIKNDKAILESGVVDELWLYGDNISNGMREEINICLIEQIPVIAMSIETLKIRHNDNL